ncbi:MAG: transposase [Candidatus Saccharibacteria bacterium]|nr:transposase [Rhodoferax sp.]
METKRVTRRKHSKEFRAEVIQACREPRASVAAIALRSGLNANVVYRWLREAAGADASVEADAGSLAVMGRCPDAEFIAVQLPPPAAAQSTAIHLEIRRGASTVTVGWPLQGAGECAAWLREWLR